MKKSQLLFLGLYIAIIGSVVVSNIDFSQGQADISSPKYPVIITPDNPIFQYSESITFTSKAVTATGPVPIKSTWSIDSTKAKLESDCASNKKSTSCTITNLQKLATNNEFSLGNISISATSPEGSKKIYGTILDFGRVLPKDSEYFLEPGKQAYANQGGKITFISKKRTKNGTGTVEVDSDWTVKDGFADDHLTETGICKGSKCTIYTNFKDEKFRFGTYLYAQPKEAPSEKLYGFVNITNTINNVFKDPLPEWALEAIISLNARDIIKGYPDGNFGPADPVSRGQWALMIYRFAAAKGVDLSQVDISNCSISDVPTDHYARTAVCVGQKLNWLDIASTEKNFRPDENLKRWEAAVMIDNAIISAYFANLKQKYSTPMDVNVAEFYSDLNPNDHFLNSITNSIFFKIIKGYEDNTFKPNNILNRAEAATIIWRTNERMLELEVHLR